MNSSTKNIIFFQGGGEGVESQSDTNIVSYYPPLKDIDTEISNKIDIDDSDSEKSELCMPEMWLHYSKHI